MTANATPRSYDTLAGVYEWLVPEPLLTPQGAARAFDRVIAALPAGARVLYCALSAMASVLRGGGGVLAVTSRNWVLVRAQGSGADLRAAGLTPQSSTHTEDAERYMITSGR